MCPACETFQGWCVLVPGMADVLCFARVCVVLGRVYHPGMPGYLHMYPRIYLVRYLVEYARVPNHV